MSVFNLSKKGSQSFPICTAMGLVPAAGEIGLEIEVEGNKFKKEAIHKNWKYVHDGSLRGADNAEYVLKKPLLFSEVPAALDGLWAMMKDFGSVLDVSNRTSVHVHLNCQEFYVDRLATFIGLYITFEEILTNWCGDHRVGNLFCLRAKDAPAIASEVIQYIRADGNYPLAEGLHYGGLNLHALSKFGSLEIRTLRGATDVATIKTWVNYLEILYKRSKDFNSPDDVCAMFSREGPAQFFEQIFGLRAAELREGAGMSINDVTDSLYEGIRIAQDVLYCRDWAMLNKEASKPDPFGRRKKPSAAITSTLEAYLNAGYTTLSQPSNPAPPPMPAPEIDWESEVAAFDEF